MNYRYIAIIRPSMDGPLTDTLWCADSEMELKLKNRFLPDDKRLKEPPAPSLSLLRMRARLNNAELIGFHSPRTFTFEEFDEYLRNLDDLETFFKKHRI